MRSSAWSTWVSSSREWLASDISWSRSNVLDPTSAWSWPAPSPPSRNRPAISSSASEISARSRCASVSSSPRTLASSLAVQGRSSDRTARRREPVRPVADLVVVVRDEAAAADFFVVALRLAADFLAGLFAAALAVVFLAGVFLAVAFFVGAFLAVAFLAGAFLAVVFVAVFFAVVLVAFAAVFLVPVLAVVLFAVVFFAVDFLAVAFGAVFLAGALVDFLAVVRLDDPVDFLAADRVAVRVLAAFLEAVLAAVFFAGAFGILRSLHVGGGVSDHHHTVRRGYACRPRPSTTRPELFEHPSRPVGGPEVGCGAPGRSSRLPYAARGAEGADDPLEREHKTDMTTPGPGHGYRPVAPQVDLPALEREILELWRQQGTFEKSLEQTRGAARWTFYEGPPTANGMPGTHHVEARVFKDVFPRFKTMQGYHVDRKAGWDCHGLPVELAVEKELGFTGKNDIEAFGIAEFNQRCRESVRRHVGAFREMTERMGYWVNLDDAYWTMNPGYVESVWWALKQIHAAGLLVEDYRVAPYCPRCGTGLSDHELAQGYETVADPSVYVRFPLTSGPYAGQASLLVWTTTPWTLVSNTAVAVHPEVDYVVASDGREQLVVAAPLLERALGEDWDVVATVSARDMERWTYQRPFELVPFPEPAHFVVLADYVTTEDGTGLVHQSPAFGQDDMLVCRAYGLPVVTPVRPDGRFDDELALVGGQFFKHADTDLVKDLEKRGLLFRHLSYEHAYPHCWRCHTPLMYYAQPSWYIRTTHAKDALLRENERTNWYPQTIKWGRYGDWLQNNVDWALSRNRYWGTPLPIWRCPEDHQTVVGSLAELSELSGSDQSGLDPHRPYVDDVTLACGRCGQTAHRVPEVIDAWFDSGSMPFAQWGYPHAADSQERFAQAYPAQFICEAIDQTRGWFYTLMAVGTLVFDRSSYENVLCLGHILAEDGRKMSKHLGNILEPMPLMEEHGADAVRWFMAAGGSPWSARRVGHATIQETVRKVLLTYWNTVAFHVLYARTNGWVPDGEVPVVADRPVLDRWLVSEAHRLVRDVTAAMEDFQTQRAGTLIGQFVDDLSNWYVRRSRRRFWAGDPSALGTLHETLDVVTRLMAPMTPFVTERVWQDVVRPVTPGAAESVHLAPWPSYDRGAVDDRLSEQMALARRVVELGRAARAEARVKTRQPLRRALVGSRAWSTLDEDLRADVAEELNIGALESLGSAGADLVDYSAKASFRALGRRFGKQTPRVAEAIAAADAAGLAAALREHGSATVEVDGQPVTVGPEEVLVAERPREGWSVVNDQGETVALDLELTPELVRAGLAREAVRLVQEARKREGLDVSDRIRLRWLADGDTAQALRAHTDLLAEEVLAVEVAEGAPEAALTEYGDPGLGLRLWLAKA
jgi:isoleucyl-tRNA synthetase